MIISKTPYRISFAGGLSDIPKYYEKNIGKVISTTIDKYVYITVNERFDGKFKITYLKGEEADCIDDIKHPIFRECLRYVGIKDALEVVSIADIPGGSGLGSSSSFTVGLLNTLYRYLGRDVNRCKLAEDACKIELDILGEPIGKQDQYAAAYGGLNYIEFNKKNVEVMPLPIDNTIYNILDDNLMLFYSGKTRKAKDILDKQTIDGNVYNITRLAGISKRMKDELSYCNLNSFASLLDEEWNIKKKTGNVSNDRIDNHINIALENGALGCKLCGAGIDGFILVYCQLSNQDKVRKAIGLRELPFKFDEKGSRIIYENRLRR